MKRRPDRITGKRFWCSATKVLWAMVFVLGMMVSAAGAIDRTDPSPEAVNQDGAVPDPAMGSMMEGSGSDTDASMGQMMEGSGTSSDPRMNYSAESSNGRKVDVPDWLVKLRRQIDSEFAIEGKTGARNRVNQAHMDLMNRVGEQGGPKMTKGMYDQMLAAHEYGNGVLLYSQSDAKESVTQGPHCPDSAPVRAYDLTAINVEVTLNQWLDYYPGYMYTLTENVEKVRAEEKKNAEARGNERDPGAVSHGLQTDLIQPLVIRANQGDCLRITLRNNLEEESAGLHLHGSSMIIRGTGKAATSANPESLVPEGGSVEMEWYIPEDFQEGALFFHSFSNERVQTSLGLLGSLIVEPKGSTYLDPIGPGDPTPLKSGWQAIIAGPGSPNFREYVIFYNDIGDEAFRVLSKTGELIPQRDPFTDAYRPSTRALNNRSEPFGVNNMEEMQRMFGFEDESLAYSSYTFGEAATPIPRAYLGDPMKYRLVHGGSEVFHSHHPHGGSIRWPRQPQTGEPLWHTASEGPVKKPLIRTQTDRVDVQTIGPAETFNLDSECGAGLCQQLAGDFLFHCHVAHHYVAGMWTYMRVYNTLQGGDFPGTSEDQMPPLRELPDRVGRMKAGVASDQLIGKTVDWFGKKFKITESASNWNVDPVEVSIKEWTEMMLPAQGLPGKKQDQREQILSFDATVLDWVWDGNKAMSEPESLFEVVKYKSPAPGDRHPILFDEKTGKLAWPALTPHFGKRPPFAPSHNGAPWLEPIHKAEDGSVSTDPAKPGENGPWSLCPDGAGRRFFNIHFIQTPLTLKPAGKNRKGITDPNGLIYVLHEEEALARKGGEYGRPLVIRGNIYDCADVILSSEWVDNDKTNFQASKINIHPHFLQFDNQASDGVISGFSYEQSVRPFTMMTKTVKKGMPLPMNTVLTADAKAGSTGIVVKDASRYQKNTELGVGMDHVGGLDIRRIKDIQGNTITFTQPLQFDHKKSEIASVEFVRYRWWMDADVGTVFWHDHAYGATTWPHGGFGAVIVEPQGSTYHNPKTGQEILSGPLADIHTQDPFGYGLSGSFRELVLQIQDTVPTTVNTVLVGNPPGMTLKAAIDSGQTISFQMPDNIPETPIPYLNGGTHTTGSAFGMRIEPLMGRLAENPDPSQVFSSIVHGDPATYTLRSYLGDPLMFRLIDSAMNEMHVFHLMGHSFRSERFAEDAVQKSALRIGIAERYDLAVKEAGGPQQKAGDYLYYNGRPSHLSEGSWGILRVFDKDQPDLKPLPGHETRVPEAKEIAPPDAPVKEFNVVAIDKPMKLNSRTEDKVEVDFERKQVYSNPEGKVFALEEEKEKVLDPDYLPNPLVLHVNVGDKVIIHLKNELKKGNVSFHADMLAYDPKDSIGANVGKNPGDQTVAPGKSKTYTFYAHPDYGETAALVWDFGDVLRNVRNGLFGAVVVGPKGSTYRDPVSGEDVTLKNSWSADVIVDKTVPGNEDRKSYRDVSLFFQDEDNIMGTSFMPYLQNLAGITAVNYRSEPIGWRVDEEDCDDGEVFQHCGDAPENPETPLFMAHAGDAVRLHVFGAFSEQSGVFSLEGHEWPLEPRMKGADMLSSSQLGGAETLNLDLRPGAGGPNAVPGTYVWQNHRAPYTNAGQWGYFKVLPKGDPGIKALDESSGKTTGTAEEKSRPKGQVAQNGSNP